VCASCGEPWIRIVDNEHRAIGWEKNCKCDSLEVSKAIVLDPFMGSGTVGVVAKKLGRDYLGIELNPDYVEIAKNRIHNTLTPIFGCT